MSRRTATLLRRNLLLSRALLGTIILLPAPSPAQRPPSPAQLYQTFQRPPDTAKPMMRWWWFGAAVQKPEILHELQQMKADGIGGVELAFVYPVVLDDPSKGVKNLPFLSPAFLDAVAYAAQQAHNLGLRIDVTLGSGWPYGGPATTFAEAAHRLRTLELSVPPSSTSVQIPPLAEGETLLSAAIVDGPPSPPHAAGPTWDPATAHPLPITTPTLTFPASPHSRTVVLFVDSNTRQQVKRAAVGAEGWVLDPFSHQAVATHLASVGKPLVGAFGSKPPFAVFSDSLEAYGADWTPNLPAEFRRRRGYDLLPQLPELVAGNTPASANFRHDWGETLTELVDENYLTQINTWALAHHTKFRSQTYGEPAVSFSSQDLAALPEGEGSQWRAFSTLRWASSANHVFGNPVTSGESFTWLHSPVFRATPLDLKAEADVDFLSGENQIIGHGWPYSPPSSQLPPGDPGWSLYAAAALNDHNPWHPVMPAVTAYIGRISYLLRQGRPANQVAVLLPTDDAWAAFTPGHVSVTGEMSRRISPELMSAILAAGYNIDFISADAINKVGLGDYELLVIPPTDRIPVETLDKISTWRTRQYAISGNRQYDVLCYRRCPSIDPQGKPLPGMTGSFLVEDDPQSLTKDMHDAVTPDLSLHAVDPDTAARIGFIRRKLPAADIYFIANTSNQPIDATATLATRFPSGRQWDPDTGLRSPKPILAGSVPLHLAPYASAVFVFARAGTPSVSPKTPTEHQIVDLSANWHVTFPALHRSVPEPTPTSWTANPATLHYSGEAVYTREFTLPSAPAGTPILLEVTGGTPIPGAPGTTPQEHVDRAPNGMPNPLKTGTGPGMHAWYDPPIREAALVSVNGHPAGALWHPPYRLEITTLLHPGLNHLEIRVFNTALNAWSALPPHNDQPLIRRYGDRFQMQDLDAVKPLPSGLLGSVHLVAGAAQ